MATIPTSGTYSSPQGTINNSNKTTISKVADKKNADGSDSENNSTTASAENKTNVPTGITTALKENADLKLALDKANQYIATAKGEFDKYQTQIQNLTGANSQQQNSAAQAAMSMMGMGGAMNAMGGAMGNWGQNGAEKPSRKKKRDEDSESSGEKDSSGPKNNPGEQDLDKLFETDKTKTSPDGANNTESTTQNSKIKDKKE